MGIGSTACVGKRFAALRRSALADSVRPTLLSQWGDLGDCAQWAEAYTKKEATF